MFVSQYKQQQQQQQQRQQQRQRRRNAASQQRTVATSPLPLPLLLLLLLLFVVRGAHAAGAADPRPPIGPLSPPAAGRALWQLGEDGGLKRAGASPPAAPHPRVWTFQARCQPGACSAMCYERTRHYDQGRCMDSTSGRRYCKCWSSAAAATVGAAVAGGNGQPSPPAV